MFRVAFDRSGRFRVVNTNTHNNSSELHHDRESDSDFCHNVILRNGDEEVDLKELEKKWLSRGTTNAFFQLGQFAQLYADPFVFKASKLVFPIKDFFTYNYITDTFTFNVSRVNFGSATTDLSSPSSSLTVPSTVGALTINSTKVGINDSTPFYEQDVYGITRISNDTGGTLYLGGINSSLAITDATYNSNYPFHMFISDHIANSLTISNYWTGVKKDIMVVTNTDGNFGAITFPNHTVQIGNTTNGYLKIDTLSSTAKITTPTSFQICSSTGGSENNAVMFADTVNSFTTFRGNIAVGATTSTRSGGLQISGSGNPGTGRIMATNQLNVLTGRLVTSNDTTKESLIISATTGTPPVANIIHSNNINIASASLSIANSTGTLASRAVGTNTVYIDNVARSVSISGTLTIGSGFVQKEISNSYTMSSYPTFYNICAQDFQVWRYSATDLTNGTKVFSINTASGNAVLAGNLTQNSGFSDSRIKTNIEPVHHEKSLQTLRGIEVYSYTKTNNKVEGEHVSFGVVAQQLKEHVPDVVSVQKGYTSDICEYGRVTHVYENGSFDVLFDSEINISKQDKVKYCIEKDDKNTHKSMVLNVSDDHTSIRLSSQHPIEENVRIYLFGKKVHDLHYVRKDDIGIIALAGAKAVYEEVEYLRSRCSTLEQEVQELKRMVTILMQNK